MLHKGFCQHFQVRTDPAAASFLRAPLSRQAPPPSSGFTRWPDACSFHRLTCLVLSWTSNLDPLSIHLPRHSHSLTPSSPSPAAAAAATPLCSPHGTRPSPWRRSPPIHSLSTSSVHFEKAKLHKLLGSRRKNCVGDRLRSGTHLRAESRGQPLNQKVLASRDSQHSGRYKPPGSQWVVTDNENGVQIQRLRSPRWGGFIMPLCVCVCVWLCGCCSVCIRY